MKSFLKKLSAAKFAAVFVIAILMLTGIAIAFQAGKKSTTFYYGVSFQQTPSGAPAAYFTYPTVSGYLNSSTSESTTGNLPINGMPVYVANDLSHIANIGDQWLFSAAADTDAAYIASPYDYILDSLVVYSTYGAGDTAIVLSYSVVAAGTVTQLGSTAGTPDTLVSASATAASIDFTGLTEAQRTINTSAGERVAFYLDEHGTLTNVTAILFGRVFYVAD